MSGPAMRKNNDGNRGASCANMQGKKKKLGISQSLLVVEEKKKEGSEAVYGSA